MPEGEVRYCTTSDGVSIAYTDAGEGLPLVITSNILASHLGYTGGVSDQLLSVGSTAKNHRIVRYDARGTGMSDRRSLDFSMEARLLDFQSVIDHLGLERFVLVGLPHGTATAVNYAVRHPDRLTHLILFCPYAHGADFQRVTKRFESARELADEDWEGYTLMMANANFRFRDSERALALAARMRDAMTAEALRAFFAEQFSTDIAGILLAVSVPTMVVSNETMTFPVEWHQEIAAGIPGARLVRTGRSQPGEWWGSEEAQALAEFLGDAPKAETAPTPSTFRTVLFTDLVGHTEMMSRLGDERGRAVLREHETITRNVLKQHGGTEVKTMGDGFMASFGSVTKAVECAVALQRAFAGREGEPLAVRVGLNAGEPIEEEGDLFGATVILASRVAAKAEGGEILVADTVRGLCSGKGFLFADRGEFVAKGFEEPVRVYEVAWSQ
jgi:class 3 adenylate cyclase